MPFLDEDKMLSMLRRLRVQTALVVGRGSAMTGLLLARHGIPSVLVMERDEYCAVSGARVAAQESLYGVTFSDGYVGSLRLRGPYDCVIVPEEFSIVSDPAASIRDYHDWLRDGGLLLFTVYSTGGSISESSSENYEVPYPYHHYDRDGAAGLVKGWSNVDIQQHGWFHLGHQECLPQPQWHESWMVSAFKPGSE